MKRLKDKEQEFVEGSRDRVMFEDINTSKEEKNIPSKEVEKFRSLEERIKRSYMLKKSTVKLLKRLQLDYYDVDVTLEDIVDEAIVKLYESKTKE